MGVYFTILVFLTLCGIGLLVALNKVLNEEEPAPRLPSPVSAQQDADDEITVIGFAPMLLDESQAGDWADSEVTDQHHLGVTHRIVHDAAAADDEPSAAFALMLFSAVGHTSRGRRRSHNEDSFLVLSDQHLFVVADGMGGHVGGAIASKMAVDSVADAFATNEFEGAPAKDLPNAGRQLAASVQMANRAVWDRTQQELDLTGMGTTLVAARFSPRKERVYIANVGDSRCYRVRGSEIELLTIDHTLGQLGVRGPSAHQLVRAVGVAPGVEVDVILAEPQHGDVYVLCSDGLNKMIDDDHVARIVAGASSPEDAAEELVHEANEAGGRDNVTVIVVFVGKPEGLEGAE
jgi:protein phosphatase